MLGNVGVGVVSAEDGERSACTGDTSCSIRGVGLCDRGSVQVRSDGSYLQNAVRKWRARRPAVPVGPVVPKPESGSGWDILCDGFDED